MFKKKEKEKAPKNKKRVTTMKVRTHKKSVLLFVGGAFSKTPPRCV